METTAVKVEVVDQVTTLSHSCEQADHDASGPSNGTNNDTKYYDPARNAHLVR
jgi:hypothetical protein